MYIVMCKVVNRPLAIRGHVINASFKQRVGILLMSKSDRAQKNYLTPEISEETHLREIFYGTLIYQQSSMICIGHQTWWPKLLFAFILLKVDSYTQMCCKCYHIIFSTFSLKFKCKICFPKEVIHNFKNHETNYELTHLRKWCKFEKPNHYFFV